MYFRTRLQAVVDAESGNMELVVKNKCYDDAKQLKHYFRVHLSISDHLNLLEVFSGLCCPTLYVTGKSAARRRQPSAGHVEVEDFSAGWWTNASSPQVAGVVRVSLLINWGEGQVAEQRPRPLSLQTSQNITISFIWTISALDYSVKIFPFLNF